MYFLEFVHNHKILRCIVEYPNEEYLVGTDAMTSHTIGTTLQCLQLGYHSGFPKFIEINQPNQYVLLSTSVGIYVCFLQILCGYDNNMVTMHCAEQTDE